MNPTMVMNVRYGYDRFLRGDQGNPGNFGMDLTTLGFPASYNNLIPADIRKFPRFDITGYQGTGVAGEDRFTENQTAMGVDHQDDGRALASGPAPNGGSTARRACSRRTPRPASSISARRGRADRSTTPPARPNSLGQSFAAFLLGLPENSSFVNRDDGYDEQSSTTGHLHPGRLARRRRS